MSMVRAKVGANLVFARFYSMAFIMTLLGILLGFAGGNSFLFRLEEVSRASGLSILPFFEEVVMLISSLND
jgi:hypothetical protein